MARATSSTGGILIALEPFHLGDQPAPARFERGDLLQVSVRIQATIAQARSDVLHVIAHKSGIEHPTILYRYRVRPQCTRRASDPDRFEVRFTQLWRSVFDNVIRKAVFPAAGLGTRFLPATKAQPKEMLPLVDKPIIQYGVEEAVESGVDNIILVTGRGKNAIEDHFDVSVELETFLEARGKKELLAEIRKISNLINFRTSVRASRSASVTRCWSRGRSSAMSRLP